MQQISSTDLLSVSASMPVSVLVSSSALLSLPLPPPGEKVDKLNVGDWKTLTAKKTSFFGVFLNL